MKSRPVRFWAVISLLLGLMAVAQALSARRESQTWDEAFELGAGYSYWKTGLYRFNLEQPPIGKLIPGLPLLFLNPSIPAGLAGSNGLDDLHFGSRFLYGNRLPADRILFAGRLGTIALTLLFGLVLALWTRAKFGDEPALLAVTLFAFDPNLIAHGHYTTTDMASAAFLFFACIAWTAYLEDPGRGRLLVAGVALGLALSTKHSALILIPVFLCMQGIRWWQQPSLFRFAEVRRAWTTLALVAYSTIALVYAPEAARFVPAAVQLGLVDPATPSMQQFVARNSFLGEALYRLTDWLLLSSNSYLVGLNDFFRHSTGETPSFLLGRFGVRGWWYYFPVVFLVKTPSVIVLTLPLLIFWIVRRRPLPDLRAVPFVWFAVLLPPAVFFAATLTSHINLGVRHLLPVYPFLYVATGAIVFRMFPAGSRTAKLAAAAIAFLAIAESCLVFPDYTSFFNTLSGGVKNGPKYLLESNIDWGQDFKKLQALRPRYGDAPFCFEYFGNADLEYYRFGSYAGIPRTSDEAGRRQVDCIAAISVNLLYGLYVGPEAFSWLRSKEPLERVGGSIYLYDLRNRARQRAAGPPSNWTRGSPARVPDKLMD